MLKKLMSFVVLGAALFAGVSPTLAHAKSSDGYDRHVVIQVSDNNKLKMNIALNNAINLTKYFKSKGKTVRVEIVTFGPGLTMLRADKSPVKARLETYTMEHPNVSFAACHNTMLKVSKKLGKLPPIIKSDQIRVVPAGVVEIMKRQDEGWNYIKL